MRPGKNVKFEAVCFFGPDPASSRFDRQFFTKLDDAKYFAQGGTFGTVSDIKSGETVARYPEAK